MKTWPFFLIFPSSSLCHTLRLGANYWIIETGKTNLFLMKFETRKFRSMPFGRLFFCSKSEIQTLSLLGKSKNSPGRKKAISISGQQKYFLLNCSKKSHDLDSLKINSLNSQILILLLNVCRLSEYPQVKILTIRPRTLQTILNDA